MTSLKKLSVSLILIFISFIGYAQVYENADSAYNKASLENKCILLIFTGSDWCPHCIRFDKNVLNDELFESFAFENLVILQADFPQHKKLSKEIERQNDKLAEKYNPKGEFPTILILNPNRTKSSYIEYSNQEPVGFINQVESKIKSFEQSE